MDSEKEIIQIAERLRYLINNDNDAPRYIREQGIGGNATLEDKIEELEKEIEELEDEMEGHKQIIADLEAKLSV